MKIKMLKTLTSSFYSKENAWKQFRESLNENYKYCCFITFSVTIRELLIQLLSFSRITQSNSIK